MGAEGSKGEASDKSDEIGFVSQLADACKANDGKGDLKRYKESWDKIKKLRDPDFDAKLISKSDENLNVMKWIKVAFRHKDKDWRQAGIEIAHSFFHCAEARRKFAQYEFVDSLLLITLPDDKVDEEDDKKAAEAEKEQEVDQLNAAKIVNDMAEYEEFRPALCSTNVLNFLCIVLNQVPQAVMTVTHTLRKLSEHEENLAILMEGAVGDILESFFKTVKFVKPLDEEEEKLDQWKKDILALSFCSNTLATLIKYNHQCQVHLPTIIRIFQYQDEKIRDGMADNVQLLAEMARLFYWICRHSPNVMQTLQSAAVQQHVADLDQVLVVLVKLWERCVLTYEWIKAVTEGGDTFSFGQANLKAEFDKFMVDDINGTPLKLGSHEAEDKMYHARQRLCYMNCTLWVLLPNSNLRWKLRDNSLRQLYLAFQLRDTEFLRVILSTVRHILDLPTTQECHELVRFFGTQLLMLLQEVLDDKLTNPPTIRLLLDTICILAMQREMQEMLAEDYYDIYGKYKLLVEKMQKKVSRQDAFGSIEASDLKKIELAVLRTLAEVAVSPSHRLDFVTKADPAKAAWAEGGIYPNRKEFKAQLEDRIKETDENFKTIGSLLLTVFQEEKFQRPAIDIETTFKSVLDWWRVNTTARYEEEKEATEAQESGAPHSAAEAQTMKPLVELLQRAKSQQRPPLTSIEAMPYCAPHECVLALALFSRLALEPKFKNFFSKGDALHALLGCVCVGIWAEAREAAATLANLMWFPDVNEERIICWLKFDGPKCITVDAANVLLPVRVGNPRPADLGKGMYKSTWGVQFVEGTCVTLHPDGLKTHEIPGLLTSATPGHTFEATSRKNYHPLEKEDEASKEKHFTITCWFYWPLTANKPHNVNVLIQSSPPDSWSQIAFEALSGEQQEKVAKEMGNVGPDDYLGVWTLTDNQGNRQVLRTPKLSRGWHMLSLVSNTANTEEDKRANKFNGTKFFLDEWSVGLKNCWVKNDFYMVGNDAGQGGRKPFGLICDFRIYARALDDKEIKAMATAKDMENHPDMTAKRLAALDAATILAQRLDVPDSAAECLRALGSLATLQSQRAKIFSVCGRQVLKMLDSPLPMIHRQAARLLNNIT